MLPKATTQPDAVALAKTAATGKGAAAVGALDSDAYPSLTAGSYVVYSGIHDSRKAATAALDTLEAQVRRGPRRAGRRDRLGLALQSRRRQGRRPRGPRRPRSESASGGQDTKKAFEESRKAPKTVGTGGKPPPTDNKPAAGGGDFEEIE